MNRLHVRVAMTRSRSTDLKLLKRFLARLMLAAVIQVARRRRQQVKVPRLQARSQPIDRDPHRVYEAACVDLADELGYKRDGIYWWWGQLAGAIEANTGYQRSVCEYMALDCVRKSFDKRGATPD